MDGKKTFSFQVKAESPTTDNNLKFCFVRCATGGYADLFFDVLDAF